MRNILLILPTWVGDCVMATPAIRALRHAYPEARITGLCRRNCKPLLGGMPWLNRVISYSSKATLIRQAARLKRGGFDAAVLLPNSFRTALLAQMAGIPRRIGYERDNRGFLLTDKLVPPPRGRQHSPVPTLRYYLGLVGYLGGNAALLRDSRMELFLTAADVAAADRVLGSAGVDAGAARPWIVLNPGAQYGPAKMWLPQYFADVADRFAARGATVLLSAAPGERSIVQEVRAHAQHAPIDLSAHGLTLGALKAICGRIDLMITNDTGPRHMAAAMGSRLVTLFGPTDPRRTTIDHPPEVELFEKVFCGPCQRKVCPLDHRCMTRLTPQRVFDAAAELLRRGSPLPVLSGA